MQVELKELDWLAERPAKGLPLHVISLDISANPFNGYLLSSIDSGNQRKRDVLILPKTTYSYLPPSIQQEWDRFNKEINRQSHDRGMGLASSLNQLESERRKGRVLKDFKLTTIVYRYGAIPALVIGKFKNFICALPPLIPPAYSENSISEIETFAMLKPLEGFFPLLCDSYYEQIGYYCRAIFYGAEDKAILEYCSSIKNLLEVSLGKMLSMLFAKKGKQSQEVSDFVLEVHQEYVILACLVHKLVSIIVEHLYGCYGVKYVNKNKLNANLYKKFAEHESPVSDFLNSCINNIHSTSSAFIQLIQDYRGKVPEWAMFLGEACIFLGEIKLAIKIRKSKLSVPRAFLGYHFKVEHGELFHAALKAKTLSDSVEIIRGRNLNNNIQWSVLALIWLSDHQLLFVPDTLRTADNKIKKIQSHDDWIIKEILYGHFIAMPQTAIVASREILGDIADKIHQYTETLELKSIREEEWTPFIKNARAQLAFYFETERYIDYVPILQSKELQADAKVKARVTEIIKTAEKDDDFIGIKRELDALFGNAEDKIKGELIRMDDRFDKQYQSLVVQRAVENFIKNVYRAWARMFNNETWSVIQVLFNECNDGEKKTIRVKDLILKLRLSANRNNQWGWVLQEPEEEKLLLRVKRHITKINDVRMTTDLAIVPLVVIADFRNPDPTISVQVHSELIRRKISSNLPENSAKALQLEISLLLRKSRFEEHIHQ